METIKEAIERVIPEAFDPDEILPTRAGYLVKLERKGFSEGIAWAERWIPVERELPDNQDIVLVKTDKGCVSTAYLHGKKSGFICYGQEAYNDFGEVTHWRPVEHK